MQRVRIGLTGLGFVFVVVLLAAVFASRPEEEEPITANLIERRLSGEEVPAARADEGQPKDPLAELGVAPGGSETNSASNKAAGAADPPPGR